MAFDVNSNKYTFIFSAVMVVVVATLLAVAAESLKPMQKMNVANEKRQNILQSVGIKVEATEAEAKYEEFKQEEFILDAYGQKKENAILAPFDVDMLKDYKGGLSKIYKLYKSGAGTVSLEDTRKSLAEWGENGADFPLYIVKGADGNPSYVVPMMGTGLWGPVWGYLAIAEDGSTVIGAMFDHKSETPGLGAEIKEAGFQVPFEGKQIFNDNNEFKGVMALKGGAEPDDAHGVDAISGGTITSNAVNEMIIRTLHIYQPFFDALRSGNGKKEVMQLEEIKTNSLEVPSGSLAQNTVLDDTDDVK